MLCSVLAGVYNEVLLKGSDSAKRGVTTNLQRLALRHFGGLAIGVQIAGDFRMSSRPRNAFMYIQSIVVNFVVLIWEGKAG
jgi:hypothetical protein